MKSRPKASASAQNRVELSELGRFARLLELESRFAFLTEALDHAAIIAVTDECGTITSVNSHFCELSGYCEAELIGENHRLIRSGVHDRGFFTHLYQTISRGEVWRGEICNRAKGGALYWVKTTIVPRRGLDGKIKSYTSIRFDITPQKAAEEALRRLANLDVLTNLPNRRKFIEDIEEHIARSAEPIEVAMIDVDGFKQVNDRFGHDIGDILLETIAHRIHRALGPGDVVGRLGGDEFAVILRAPDASADSRIQHVLSAMRAPVMIGLHEHRVSGSIGTAIFPRDGTGASAVLKAADIALYAAKRAGRDRAIAFDPAMRSEESDPRRRSPRGPSARSGGC